MDNEELTEYSLGSGRYVFPLDAFCEYADKLIENGREIWEGYQTEAQLERKRLAVAAEGETYPSGGFFELIRTADSNKWVVCDSEMQLPREEFRKLLRERLQVIGDDIMAAWQEWHPEG